MREGTVSIVLHGPEWIAPLNPHIIERTLDRNQIRVTKEPAFTTQGGEVSEHVLELDVRAHPRIPTGSEPNDSIASAIGRTLADLLSRELQSPTAEPVGVRIGGTDSNAVMRTVTAQGEVGRIASTNIDEAGIRRTT